jgi:hypothetical protein
MGNSRLSAEYPDLDNAIEAASPDRRLQAGWAAAQWAIRISGLSHPVVFAAEMGGSTEAIAAVVEKLDDRYFELQELCDEGKCSKTDVLAAFAQARAANALEYAIQGNATESIYEAAVCSDDISDLRKLVAIALE